MMQRPLLFLDFDGVLNHREFLDGKALRRGREAELFCPLALERLDGVLRAANAIVVISSSWRMRYSLEELRVILGSAGLRETERLTDVTPALLFAKQRRGAEIDDYLRSRNLNPESFRHYAVVDDEVEELTPPLPVERVVATSFDGGGLTAERATALLATLQSPQSCVGV